VDFPTFYCGALVGDSINSEEVGWSNPASSFFIHQIFFYKRFGWVGPTLANPPTVPISAMAFAFSLWAWLGLFPKGYPTTHYVYSANSFGMSCGLAGSWLPTLFLGCGSVGGAGGHGLPLHYIHIIFPMCGLSWGGRVGGSPPLIYI